MFQKDLKSQIDDLRDILASSELISEVLEKAPQLNLPNWYLGAGAIAQTVWNKLHDYPLEQNIKDCDLVYFDSDTSAEAQDLYIQKGKELFDDLPVEVEITNEARVHLWYEQEFGKEMRQYVSTENAIDTWPTTATSVGVCYEGDEFVVYAPYGLHDLLGMIVRPNKTLITSKVYTEKVDRWRKAWPNLTIIPW
jgi:uncharacterized protein